MSKNAVLRRLQQRRRPILGPAFDQHQTNDDVGRVLNYVSELEHYRPRGFSALAAEGRAIAKAIEKGDEKALEGGHDDYWMDVCETKLTEWARRVERHPYIIFGAFDASGDVGFYINVEGAMEDADLKIEAGAEVPRGFSGMVVSVTDHGNVSAFNYSRGRKTRELFAVV